MPGLARVDSTRSLNCAVIWNDCKQESILTPIHSKKIENRILFAIAKLKDQKEME